MAIARHDCFGLGDQGTGKYSIVVRVRQNYRWNSHWLDRGCKSGIAEHEFICRNAGLVQARLEFVAAQHIVKFNQKRN